MTTRSEIKAALFERLQGAWPWASSASSELGVSLDAPAPSLALQSGDETAEYGTNSSPIWSREFELYIGSDPDIYRDIADAIEGAMLFSLEEDGSPPYHDARFTTLGGRVVDAHITDVGHSVIPETETTTWHLLRIIITVRVVGQ